MTIGAKDCRDYRFGLDASRRAEVYLFKSREYILRRPEVHHSLHSLVGSRQQPSSRNPFPVGKSCNLHSNCRILVKHPNDVKSLPKYLRIDPAEPETIRPIPACDNMIVDFQHQAKPIALASRVPVGTAPRDPLPGRTPARPQRVKPWTDHLHIFWKKYLSPQLGVNKNSVSFVRSRHRK